MVLPDALLLTVLFLCPLQCLARPHLIDVLGALCRIHYNGHTVVGHLDNAKSDYCPVPVCFPWNAKPKPRPPVKPESSLPVRQDAYLSIMGGTTSASQLPS